MIRFQKTSDNLFLSNANRFGLTRIVEGATAIARRERWNMRIIGEIANRRKVRHVLGLWHPIGCLECLQSPDLVGNVPAVNHVTAEKRIRKWLVSLPKPVAVFAANDGLAEIILKAADILSKLVARRKLPNRHVRYGRRRPKCPGGPSSSTSAPC